MSEIWKMVMAFIFGAGGLALINIAQERWKIRYERKAKKEDKVDEYKESLNKINTQLEEFTKKQHDYNEQVRALFKDMEANDSTFSEAMKYVLLDRILYLGQHYIKSGEVTFDDRKRLREMHNCYHNGLGGNGDADSIMSLVDKLPLKR